MDQRKDKLELRVLLKTHPILCSPLLPKTTNVESLIFDSHPLGFESLVHVSRTVLHYHPRH